MRHGLIDPVSLQRMLYDTLDHSDDCVLVLELAPEDTDDLVIVSANDAFCHASRFNQEELVGTQLHALVAAAATAESHSGIARAAHERRSLRTEILCRRKDGEPFWFGLHLMPVRDGTPSRCIVLGRDITESLHARQQQAAVQGLLAKVFLVAKAPVAIVSEQGLIQMTNPALDDLLGYPPGHLVGKNALDCIAPEKRAAVFAARQQQIADGHDYTTTTELLRADGSRVDAEITSISVQRDDLRRFRIITLLPQQGATPATKVQVAGKIRLIGLDEIKDALGARWPAVAERAMASAEHVIRRHCVAGDTNTRTEDGGFLICFASATEQEAGFRAAAIAREIRAKLIGEGETEAAASVSAVVATVHVPQVPGQSADVMAAVINERLNNRLAQIEAKARTTLRDAVNLARCHLEPVRSRRTREVVAHFATLPCEQEQPILAAYSALPMSERRDFDFDQLVLGVAAEQAITEIGTGGSQLVLVNVDVEVFLERRRTERYVAACRALDGRVRERLVLVLSGIPHSFPKSRVLDCVMRLRPFCHSIGFQSEGIEAPVTELSLLSGAMVVLPGDLPATRDAAKLAKLVDSMHAYQARVLMRHVASWNDAKNQAKAGVDFLSLTADEKDA